MRKKVIIIGAGARVRETILPALYCLDKEFEVVSVVSRHRQVISYARSTRPIETVTDINSINFAKTDIVILAATLSQVPAILESIPKRHWRSLALFVDTPVLAYFHLPYLSEFKGFRRVIVSEEQVALPAIKLARELILGNKIGKVKNVFFSHFGYQYHAYAVLKYLTCSVSAVRISHENFGRNQSQKIFLFPNGIRGMVSEPQDYAASRFLIAGEEGSIADYHLAGTNRIEYLVEGGLYWGLRLNGKRLAPGRLDRLYLGKIRECLPEPDLMGSMKVRAFMDLLAGGGFNYSPAMAFADQLIVAASERLPFSFDLPFMEESALTRLIDIASRLLPSSLVLPKMFSV